MKMMNKGAYCTRSVEKRESVRVPTDLEVLYLVLASCKEDGRRGTIAIAIVIASKPTRKLLDVIHRGGAFRALSVCAMRAARIGRPYRRTRYVCAARLESNVVVILSTSNESA